MLFRPVVYLMIFIYGLDGLAQKLDWYYSSSIWWFDMLVHFLGGFWVGMFFVWFFSEARLPFFRRPIRTLDQQTMLQALLFVLFVAISWEAGEILTYNYIGQTPWSALDTSADIFLSLAGGVAALFYCLRKIMTERQNNVQPRSRTL